MKKILFLCFMASGMAVIFNSCEKATIDQGSFSKVYDPSAPVDSVRFSTGILPIFTSDCIMCHGDGGSNPELTASEAYSNLTATPGQYINLTSPASSHLYLHITEIPNSHGGGIKAAAGEKILTWIQQGALNN
jgi:hypothetical protein